MSDASEQHDFNNAHAIITDTAESNACGDGNHGSHLILRVGHVGSAKVFDEVLAEHGSIHLLDLSPLC